MRIGLIEVICGPMFSGKTTELLRQVEMALISKMDIAVFKPKIDNRYKSNEICTNNGYCIKANVVKKSAEIVNFINKNPKKIEKIFIDEVQFFDKGIIKVVEYLAKEKGIDITLCGLNQTFRGEPFGPMPQLLGIAQKVKTLTAICVHKNKDGTICRKPAYFTQRLIDGKPASYSSPTILVGGSDSYTARCEEHWEMLDKPKISLD